MKNLVRARTTHKPCRRVEGFPPAFWSDTMTNLLRACTTVHALAAFEGPLLLPEVRSASASLLPHHVTYVGKPLSQACTRGRHRETEMCKTRRTCQPRGDDVARAHEPSPYINNALTMPWQDDLVGVVHFVMAALDLRRSLRDSL